MGIFRKNNLKSLCKKTYKTWQRKLKAPENDRTSLIQMDRIVVSHLLEQAKKDRMSDRYVIWFIKEGEAALNWHNTTLKPNKLLLMGTVNTCLSNTSSDIPEEFKDMSSFQIFYTLYINTLDIKNEAPAFGLE